MNLYSIPVMDTIHHLINLNNIPVLDTIHILINWYSIPYQTGHFDIKVKVKVTLEQATKAQRWSRGIALLFL
jgi:hypothetical protein